jgi:signal transduction histidine kinase
MSDQLDEIKQCILSADTRALMRQLNMDLRSPLTSAQNIANMLALILNSPSPSIQRRLESGELNPPEMVEQLATLLNQAFDVLDLYRNTLEEE